MSKQQRREIVRAVQRAQDAQTGYCADYCAKNQPMAFHEIKEFQKGHQQLQSNYQQEPLEKLGKRHVTRFLSDAYCKGIVRGQVECCNLRAYNNQRQWLQRNVSVTAAFAVFLGVPSCRQLMPRATRQKNGEPGKDSVGQRRAGRTKATARAGSGASVWT